MSKRFLTLLLCLPVLAQAPDPAKKSADKKAAVKPVAAKSAAAAKPAGLPPRAAGNPDAPIVLEVFSDFQCPGCKALYMLSLRRVIEEYCNPGKVYLIHHDFPLDQIHKYSRKAAHWAVASAVIGKYEPVTEAIFSKQENWSATGNIEPAVAEVLSAGDLKKVKEIMAARDAEIEAAIETDAALGRELKVLETPSVQVKNKGKIVSALAPAKWQYTVLKRFLDDQLSK